MWADAGDVTRWAEWVRPAAWAEKKGHAQIAELLRKWQKVHKIA